MPSATALATTAGKQSKQNRPFPVESGFSAQQTGQMTNFLLFIFSKKRRQMDEVVKATVFFFHASTVTGMSNDEFIRRVLLLYRIKPTESEKLCKSASKLAMDGLLGPTLVFTIWSKTGLAFSGRSKSMEQLANKTTRTFDLATRSWNRAMQVFDKKFAPKLSREDCAKILQTLPQH